MKTKETEIIISNLNDDEEDLVLIEHKIHNFLNVLRKEMRNKK